MKIMLPDQAKLLRNFSRCRDWEERYLYLIELGKITGADRRAAAAAA